jgi:hypothetical protein
MEKNLILKFSTIVPGQQMETIIELVTRYNLAIEDAREEAHLRVVSVAGSPDGLAALDQELVRHASISRRMVSTLSRPRVP